MRRYTILSFSVLLLAWFAFLQWQYRSYHHERALIEETLHQQAHSVMNALIGGIRSHRRIGFYFDAQIRGALEELAQSADVVAVAVASSDETVTLSAGETGRLPATPVPPTPDSQDGHGRNETEYWLVERFQLSPLMEPGQGGGRKEGRGGGRGRGGGPWWMGDEDPEESPFAAGGEFKVVLVLDTARADRLLNRAAWLHLSVAIAGSLVLVFISLAWWASVRLATVRGRARVLETEARYLRELSQAAAGLAHETRNPLGLVRGWTQRLARPGADDPHREEHAQAVIEECDRITARINQFLAFARPRTPKMEPVDLNELTAELSAIVQPDLEAKGLTLSRELPAEARRVSADRELLRQALFNLLQNAIHFSPQNGKIVLRSVKGHGGLCRLEVADSGPGVPENQVESLFTPYFTTRPDGTGLGLAIVRQIATLHGWEVRYQEPSGGGSLFVLDGIHA